ncbi:MAG: GNAT family N-acetyltransferase [Bacteroidetes bacterium]|jgi:ribosomal protein S18 acetylase RimI-like enzyme|nr:GNAT family N-acetyltransferase [Bacteroidota bacterium]
MSSNISIDKFSNNSLNQRTLYNLLVKLDGFYIPKISDRVNLRAYSVKLLQYGKVFYVKADVGEYIGLLAIYVNDIINHNAFISSIGILPEYHGLGISEKLINKAFAVAIKNGMKSVSLEANNNNNRALGFYKKCGFFEEKRIGDTFFMTKNLLGTAPHQVN